MLHVVFGGEMDMGYGTMDHMKPDRRYTHTQHERKATNQPSSPIPPPGSWPTIKPLFSCWFVLYISFVIVVEAALTFYCGKWRPPHLLHRVIMNNMAMRLSAITWYVFYLAGIIHSEFYVCLTWFSIHSRWSTRYNGRNTVFCFARFLGNFLILLFAFHFDGGLVIHNLILKHPSKIQCEIIFQSASIIMMSITLLTYQNQTYTRKCNGHCCCSGRWNNLSKAWTRVPQATFQMIN